MHWYLHHRRIFSTAEWKPGQIKRYSNGICRIIYCGYCNRTLQDAKKHCSQRGNLRWRDERIHLRVDGCGLVVAVDSYALPLLQDFAETLGERFAVSPTTCPEKIFPTVFITTLASCRRSRVPTGRNPEIPEARPPCCFAPSQSGCPSP